VTTNTPEPVGAGLANARNAINACRWEEAEKSCLEILSKYPEHLEARYLLAFIYQNSGQPERAIEAYRWLLSRQGANADLLNNLGIAHEAAIQPEDALNCYRQAIRHNPSHLSALYNLGRFTRTAGNPGEAIDHLTAALSINYQSGPVLLELGMSHKALGNHDEAIIHLQRAQRIEPSNPAITNALGNTWQAHGELDRAIDTYKAALQLKPDFAEACNNLGTAYLARGNLTSALKYYEMATDIRPDWAGARSNILLAKNYLSNDPAPLYAEHLQWADNLEVAPRPTIPAINRKPGDQIRIGYVSPDFRMHSVAYFFYALLRNHDKTRFAPICFSDTAHEDSLTGKLKMAASEWHNICGKSDDDVYRLIQTCHIDILVDLAGHTANNRLTLFAMQAAPVQVSYLGYPNTTGLPTIQYRITDHWADPDGEPDVLHSEKLVRFTHGFLSYTPALESPDTGNIPAISNGYVTFGSFNVVAKISDACIETWCQILHSVPDSRILIKSAGLQDPESRDYLLKRFAQYEIAPERIELVARTRDYHSHMALYRNVDIALDTFPYNGTTTTCEALWMGVPVITLTGNRHAGRVGCSLLNQAGLTEMIASSANEYIGIARTLASKLQKLGTLRSTLRKNLAYSPLCDSFRLTREFEAAYQRMMGNSCS